MVPKRFEIIYPPNILIVTALIAAFAKIGQKISKVYFDTKIFQRASEVEELYIFYFLLLYIIVLTARILKARIKP